MGVAAASILPDRQHLQIAVLVAAADLGAVPIMDQEGVAAGIWKPSYHPPHQAIYMLLALLERQEQQVLGER